MKTLLVPVYREPDENAPLLKRLPADTTVTVIARADPWLFIQFAPEEHGYIRASEAHPLYPRDSDTSAASLPALEPSQTPPLPYIVSPATSSLSVPVFCEPSLNAQIIGNLDAGARIYGISQDESWLYIQFSLEQRGYIEASNAHLAGAEELDRGGAASIPRVVQSTAKAPYPLLNPRRYIIKPTVGVRAAVFREANQNSEILGTLEPDTIVEVVWISERWLGIQRSPEEYGYIRRVNARPARTGELGRAESSNGSTPAVKPSHPLMSQPLRYVVSPTLSMRIPVFQKADRDSKILEYLEPETIVEVVWKTEIWLCINRSSGEYGYIKAMYATPFSGKEKPYRSTYSSGLSPRMVYSTGSYIDSKAKARPWFRATRSLFGFSIFLLFGGAILGSIQEQVCVFIFCQTTYPFAQLAEVCYVFGFILLAIGVVTLITALVIRASP